MEEIVREQNLVRVIKLCFKGILYLLLQMITFNRQYFSIFKFINWRTLTLSFDANCGKDELEAYKSSSLECKTRQGKHGKSLIFWKIRSNVH